MPRESAALSCVMVATVSLKVPAGVGPVDGDSSTAFRAATSSRSAVLKGPCSSRRNSADKFSMASRIGDFSIRFIESWFRIESISGGKTFGGVDEHSADTALVLLGGGNCRAA